jgi:hypothetical protein
MKIFKNFDRKLSDNYFHSALKWSWGWELNPFARGETSPDDMGNNRRERRSSHGTSALVCGLDVQKESTGTLQKVIYAFCG